MLVNSGSIIVYRNGLLWVQVEYSSSQLVVGRVYRVQIGIQVRWLVVRVSGLVGFQIRVIGLLLCISVMMLIISMKLNMVMMLVIIVISGVMISVLIILDSMVWVFDSGSDFQNRMLWLWWLLYRVFRQQKNIMKVSIRNGQVELSIRVRLRLLLRLVRFLVLMLWVSRVRFRLLMFMFLLLMCRLLLCVVWCRVNRLKVMLMVFIISEIRLVISGVYRKLLWFFQYLCLSSQCRVFIGLMGWLMVFMCRFFL